MTWLSMTGWGDSAGKRGISVGSSGLLEKVRCKLRSSDGKSSVTGRDKCTGCEIAMHLALFRSTSWLKAGEPGRSSQR